MSQSGADQGFGAGEARLSPDDERFADCDDSDQASGCEPLASIDFALAAWREEGCWQVTLLPPRAATDLHVLIRVLAQLPSDAGVIGMVSVDEDFFVLVRVLPSQPARMLLSDVGAATESPLAVAVLDEMALPYPDADDDRIQPAGDLGLVADLGLPAMDLAALCDDAERYPDEMLGDIAGRLGFAAEFDSALETADA